jgi:hypothetical protein
VGRKADADEILADTSHNLQRLVAAGDLLVVTEISRARIAALTGKQPEAKALLRDAVLRGWKGQWPAFGADPESDPAFSELRADADFLSIVALFNRLLREEAKRLAAAVPQALH